MDKDKVRKVLAELLIDIANKAREDSLNGESDIGSIFRRDHEILSTLNAEVIEDAIRNINKATATKEGARRLINGVMVAAKAAARIALP